MIVVTGASGLLGANILLYLHDLGREAVGICRLHPFRVPDVPVHLIDLTHRATTLDLVQRLRPKSIIHCAATTNVDWCESHPQETEQVNVYASSNLAQVAQELNSSFIYVSTDA